MATGPTKPVAIGAVLAGALLAGAALAQDHFNITCPTEEMVNLIEWDVATRGGPDHWLVAVDRDPRRVQAAEFVEAVVDSATLLCVYRTSGGREMWARLPAYDGACFHSNDFRLRRDGTWVCEGQNPGDCSVQCAR